MRLPGAIAPGLIPQDTAVHGWAYIFGSNLPTATLLGSENVASLTDNGLGDLTVTWALPMGSASGYALLIGSSYGGSAATHHFQQVQAMSATAVQTLFFNFSANPGDPRFVYLAAVGET